MRDLKHIAQAKRSDNRVMAWGLRLSGMTYAQIGDALGCSTPWAFKLVQEAFKDREDEPAELARGYEMERLDAALRTVVSILDRSTRDDSWDPEMALKAVDRLVKVSESRRKLLGLDMPAKLAEQADPAEAAEREMREWLARQKAATHQGNGLKAEAAF